MTAPQSPPPARWTPAQIRLAGFIVVLAVANMSYRLVYATGIQQTAALYIGVPTVLAVGLALLPRQTKSATGMLLKGATLTLLIACVILPEGALCLLFAAPIVVLVAVFIGIPIDEARRRQRGQVPPLMAAGLPLLLLSLEGVVGTPFDPSATATAAVTVEAGVDEVAAALARPPTFDQQLPTFLTAGFNRPVAATGSGLAVGDDRAITFDGGTHDDHPLSVVGMVGGSHADHTAQMHLSVVESAPGRVVFAVTHDGTMLSRWVDLDRAVVSWRAVDDDTTRVTWSLEYERLLFPTAYFAPLQGYGME
ncbi:MAG TPA: hypothetical protein VK507_04510, partial [Iamia sp.]|nr:hypothetical protein [Iamia sp.]